MKPVLFSAPMVKAILDGRKTMTRRLPNARVRRKWNEYDEYTNAVGTNLGFPNVTYSEHEFYELYPPYFVGDVLWVRETYAWATGDYAGGGYGLFDTYVYKADGKSQNGWPIERMMVSAWRPALFMPQEAARIFLNVTNVRMERLQDIPRDDVAREGIASGSLREFRELWDGLRKSAADRAQYGWDANPWVWVISFERCEKP